MSDPETTDPKAPPEFLGINVMMMTERELAELHIALGEWVADAEAEDVEERPPQKLIDAARAVVRTVAVERAHRRVM